MNNEGNKSFNIPPVTLDYHFFPYIQVGANENLSSEDLKNEDIFTDYCIKTEVESLHHKEDPLKFQVTLTIEYDNNELDKAYDFKIKVVGFFTCDEKLDETQIKKVRDILAPSMLYGASRDFLMTLTFRGPFQPVYLPTVSFVHIEEQTHKENTKD